MRVWVRESEAELVEVFDSGTVTDTELVFDPFEAVWESDSDNSSLRVRE